MAKFIGTISITWLGFEFFNHNNIHIIFYLDINPTCYFLYRLGVMALEHLAFCCERLFHVRKAKITIFFSDLLLEDDKFERLQFFRYVLASL